MRWLWGGEKIVSRFRSMVCCVAAVVCFADVGGSRSMVCSHGSRVSRFRSMVSKLQSFGGEFVQKRPRSAKNYPRRWCCPNLFSSGGASPTSGRELTSERDAHVADVRERAHVRLNSNANANSLSLHLRS